MSRHTLEDGITPDPKIQKSCYDLWLKILGPPAKLLGDYYKRGLLWEAFEAQYNQFITHKHQKKVIFYLASAALTRNLTLLCVESSPEKCHRRLIAEACKRYQPDLEVRIN